MRAKHVFLGVLFCCLLASGAFAFNTSISVLCPDGCAEGKTAKPIAVITTAASPVFIRAMAVETPNGAFLCGQRFGLEVSAGQKVNLTGCAVEIPESPDGTWSFRACLEYRGAGTGEEYVTTCFPRTVALGEETCSGGVCISPQPAAEGMDHAAEMQAPGFGVCSTAFVLAALLAFAFFRK